jgi:hypothetical protein
MKIKTLIVGILLSVLSLMTNAKQTAFNKQQNGNSVQLEYRWTDQFGKNYEMSLSFPKESLNQSFNNNKNYSPKVAQRYVFLALQKAAMKVNPREARVKLNMIGQDIRVEVNSRSDSHFRKWQNQMATEQESAFDDYLSQHYYTRYEAPYGQKAVKPDHIRFANESVDVLTPVAQALYELIPESSSSREYINLVLSWVQSIPYNTLENRLTSNGSGYSPPLKVISDNRGDCDSKSVLTAALLKSLIPGIDLNMVFLNNHALLAANLPHREHEKKITIGSSEFLLLEPTGPALMLAGQVGSQSESAIAGGQYTLESF